MLKVRKGDDITFSARKSIRRPKRTLSIAFIFAIDPERVTCFPCQDGDRVKSEALAG
jgi:hypothetical protein